MESIYIRPLLLFLWGLICGMVAKSVGKYKATNGFLWGFLLGPIGIFIVACMPNNIIEDDDEQYDKYDKLEKIYHLKEIGAISEAELEKEKKKILEKEI